MGFESANVTAFSVAFLMSHENKGFIFKSEKPGPSALKLVKRSDFFKVIGLLRMKPKKNHFRF